MQAYIFRAINVRVIDGDTLECTLDIGFGLTTKKHFRLWGVNTPEKRSENPDARAKAYEAMEFVASHVENQDILVQTYKTEKYGRYLAKVFIPHEGDTYLCLNDLLIQEGLAVPFMTNTDLLS